MQPEYASKRVRVWSYIRILVFVYRPSWRGSNWGQLRNKTTRVSEKRPPFANLRRSLCTAFRAGSPYEISFDSLLRQIDIER